MTQIIDDKQCFIRILHRNRPEQVPRLSTSDDWLAPTRMDANKRLMSMRINQIDARVPHLLRRDRANSPRLLKDCWQSMAVRGERIQDHRLTQTGGTL